MSKKLVVAVVLSLAATAVAGPKSTWERVASQELKGCLSLASEPGFEIVAQETYGSACFAGGAQVTVDFYKVARCSGPQCASIRLAAEHVATAQFTCDAFDYGVCYVEPDPIFCLAVYEPVCGVDGQTYSNACNAEANGVYDYVDGECADADLTICPAVYEPVCGKDGMTYSNACVAESRGVVDYTAGECRSDAVTF